MINVSRMREGDEKKSVEELMKKYPYNRAKEIVLNGWDESGKN